MATLRNKPKPATLNKEDYEEHPRNNWAQNSNVPRSQEDYITEVSGEIEVRVTEEVVPGILRDGEPHFRRAIPS